MNSTIMVQKSVKDIAARKAKQEGLSLSVVTRFLLQGYAEGKLNIGLVLGNNVSINKTEIIDLDTSTQSKINNSAKKWRSKIKL
ncbi:hypothetical protein KAI58_04880 [Candidatus Gracilibacteria bacterium]|nr:hypothetical protein [Candidatus Gracilibacteria bacterium]